MEEKISCIPDFWMQLCCAARPKEGEDNYCHSFCPEAGLLAVFDGCGGLGAQRHEAYENKTEAFVAAGLCSGAVFDAFRDTFPGEETAEEFAARSEDYCSAVLEKYCPPVTLNLRGSMVKKLPTTAAVLLLQREEEDYLLTPLWAGDSRAYLLTPQGLCQLTADDTTVPDPMDNLYEDGVLRNILCASYPPRLSGWSLPVKPPFVAFTATDGCFGYFSTPMEFEAALLSTLENAKSADQWQEALEEAIAAVAGDDFTLCLAAYGFSDFSALQESFRQREAYVREHYLTKIRQMELSDRGARTRLWEEYKTGYMQYIKDEHSCRSFGNTP